MTDYSTKGLAKSPKSRSKRASRPKTQTGSPTPPKSLGQIDTLREWLDELKAEWGPVYPAKTLNIEPFLKDLDKLHKIEKAEIEENVELYREIFDVPDDKFMSMACEIADLVKAKQEAYGDSFGKADRILEILYPSGISLASLPDALTIVRVIDKLFRIATKKDAFGESPWKDIMGYALLASVRDASQMASKASGEPVEALTPSRKG